MAAIITTPFRVVNASAFKADVQNNNIYIGIGKSDAWSTNLADATDSVEDVPGDHIDDLNQAHQQLIGLKKVTVGEISHVVRRINWEFGKTFSPYDSNDTDLFDKDFYCLTSEFKVYKCIIAGNGGSEVQPYHTASDLQSYADGYVWKYMYTIIASDSEAYLTNTYMPVKTLAEFPVLSDTEVNYPQQQSQIDSRALSTAQGIQRIVVTDGGQGYADSDVFTITITGDYDTAATIADADVIVNNGAITGINVDLSGTDAGKGYNVADIIIESTGGGQNATARAIIEPHGGHGTDPVAELGGFFIGINTQLSGNEVTINNDFRQITIIRNPTLRTQTNGIYDLATADVINPLKYLLATSSPTAFEPDTIVTGQTSGAKAFVAYSALQDNRIYYYQNEKTGYEVFQNSENISNGTDQISLASPAVRYGDAADGGPYKIGSGEIIFLENRQPIDRSATQIEDIKCIIEF